MIVQMSSRFRFQNPPKNRMTLEKPQFLIGDTSSTGCVSIVMLVLEGNLTWHNCASWMP